MHFLSWIPSIVLVLQTVFVVRKAAVKPHRQITHWLQVYQASHLECFQTGGAKQRRALTTCCTRQISSSHCHAMEGPKRPKSSCFSFLCPFILVVIITNGVKYCMSNKDVSLLSVFPNNSSGLLGSDLVDKMSVWDFLHFPYSQSQRVS